MRSLADNRASADDGAIDCAAGDASAVNNVAHAILLAFAGWPRPRGNAPVALECEGSAWAVRDATAAVIARAGQLRALGVRPGDAVLLGTGRGNIYWTDLFALWSTGAVAVPVEFDMPASRLAIVAERSASKWSLGRIIGLSESGFSGVRAIGNLPHGPDARAHHAHTYRVEPVSKRHPALILFTSGSTGEPKGARLSHRAVLGNARATQVVAALQPGDRLCAVIPFRFVSALSHALVALLSHATFCGYEERMFAADFCRRLVSVGCSAYGGSPLQAQWIAAHAERAEGQGDIAFPRLHWLMSSGDHLSEEVIDRLRNVIPDIRIVVAYGMTEAAGRICCRVIAPGDGSMPGSIGLPLAGMRVAVRRDDGNLCTPGEMGMVHIEGNYLFDGYAGSASQTEACMFGDEFVTGDLGSMAMGGFLTLAGRADDVFKVAGRKISIIPIATALMETGWFTDVAVLAERHPKLGHVPCLYYVLRADRVFDRSLLVKELRARLPSSHLPRRFVPVASIARTGSGKVDRAALTNLPTPAVERRLYPDVRTAEQNTSNA